MKRELPPIAVGDVVTWRGPRNHGSRAISGVVHHVGKIFVTVRGSSQWSSQESYIKKSALLEIRNPKSEA